MKRYGLTVLEFSGCLVAVVGGAWLGALYLGVDLQHIAYTALAEAELLETLPEGWRPKPPQDTMTREQLVSRLRDELGSLRTEISALREGKSLPESVPPTTQDQADSSATSPVPTKQRTLAYWLRISEIALGETALQEDADTAFNEENAAKVFAIKGRICRFAAKAVEAIPTAGVDDTAQRFGRELQLWYDDGGELYEQALRIWETGPQARTKLNAEWDQAHEHHRNAAKLIYEKASVVRGSISRTYGEEFPEFTKPAKPVENKDDQKGSA